MNILKVKVPEVLYKRVCTGIDWLDNLLSIEGGFVPSLVYMLSGNPGAGKSTLNRQIGDALTGNGHVVLYNSGEESKEQIAIGCEKLELQHGFEFSNEVDVHKLLDRLNKLKAAKPEKHLILIQDSLQKLSGVDENGDTLTNAAAFELLRNWAKKSLSIVIVISQVTKAGVFKGSNSVPHDADTQMSMNYSKKTGKRVLIIEKSRFGLTTDDGGFEYVITANGVEPAPEGGVEFDTSDAPNVTFVSNKFKAGQWVRTTPAAPPKHHDRMAKIKNVGRTRIEAFTSDGTKLYLPHDCFTTIEEQSNDDSAPISTTLRARAAM